MNQAPFNFNGSHLFPVADFGLDFEDEFVSSHFKPASKSFDFIRPPGKVYTRPSPQQWAVEAALITTNDTERQINFLRMMGAKENSSIFSALKRKRETGQLKWGLKEYYQKQSKKMEHHYMESLRYSKSDRIGLGYKSSASDVLSNTTARTNAASAVASRNKRLRLSTDLPGVTKNAAADLNSSSSLNTYASIGTIEKIERYLAKKNWNGSSLDNIMRSSGKYGTSSFSLPDVSDASVQAALYYLYALKMHQS
mmetsp:Transcript_20190/g.35970  ORF Transcript_20190/g.35970 Transcript_20190/m.35970 type:complete len:253 (+) Transcript_20190:540-1298(+)